MQAPFSPAVWLSVSHVTHHLRQCAHTRSHSPLWWSQSHTRAQHTNINHCCSLEWDPVVYFPQGSSSSTVSAQHPHWVNVVSHPETQKPTVWGFVWMAVCRCITVLCKSTVMFPLQWAIRDMIFWYTKIKGVYVFSVLLERPQNVLLCYTVIH